MLTSSIPIKVTPRWLFMNHLSLKSPDTAQLVEIEPYEKRLPDDILVRHEPPYTTVRRIIPVVAHHEIVPGGHGAGHALGIVVAIFAKRERPRKRHGHWSVAFLEYGVLHAAERFLELCRIVYPFAVEVVGDLRARLRNSIDREPLVLVDDLVPGHADQTLHIVDRRIFGKPKHHHVAPARISDA